MDNKKLMRTFIATFSMPENEGDARLELIKLYESSLARAEAAELDLAAAQSAAHMPADYPHGLPSWINQHLYAAYIGARFSDSVMEQIRNGRLAFPEAPVYTELAATLARITELEAQLAAQAWRPVTEPPTEIGHYLLIDANSIYCYWSMWNNGWLHNHDINPLYWLKVSAPPIDPPAPA